MNKVKILHVLYESLPSVSGSTIRTRDVLDCQLSHENLVPVALTSPFQNGDDGTEIINGVRHYRHKSVKKETASERIKRNPLILIKKLFRIISFTFKIIEVGKKENIDVIHAHAMFFCALSAKMASIWLNKPVIYEVRSLWEERGKDKRPILTKIFIWLENLSIKAADEVICINENLRIELIKRSNYKRTIHIVPNAVNFNQIKVNEEPKLNGELVFGYIGAISPIEGLDILLEVIDDLKKSGIELQARIYGSGIFQDHLNNFIKENELSNVKLLGQVNPLLISQAYDTIDVIINPRKKSKLSDLVTPLKPLEALAYKKLLVVSDVGGMSQLISQKDIAFSFCADNKESLKEAIISTLNESEVDKVKRINTGFEYVRINKNWLDNGTKYHQIYQKALTRS